MATGSIQKVRTALGHLWPVLGLLLPLAAATLLLPLLGSLALDQAVTEALITLVAVVGLYIFIGNSGIMSFGHVAFMAIGAYASAWQSCCPMLKPIVMSGLPDFMLQTTVPDTPAAILSGLFAALAALVAGAVILRLSGIAASIASFALLFIVNVVYSNADRFTEGVGSIVGLSMYVTPTVALVWAAITIVVAYGYQRSRFGRAIRAAREDEVAAKASGIDVYVQRLLAFVLSAFFMGVAGALYGSFIGTISVDSFYLDMTFILVAMLVIGGARSLAGAVTGVVAVATFNELARQAQGGAHIFGRDIALPAQAQGIGLALFMLAILTFRNKGLMGGRELGEAGRDGAGRPVAVPGINRFQARP